MFTSAACGVIYKRRRNENNRKFSRKYIDCLVKRSSRKDNRSVHKKISYYRAFASMMFRGHIE